MKSELRAVISLGPDGEACCHPVVANDAEEKELTRRLAQLVRRLSEDPSLPRRAAGLEPTSRPGQRRSEAVAAALAAERKRDGRAVFIGNAWLDCENTSCAVREVEIIINEHHGPPPPSLGCPACGCALLLRHVWTRAEAIAEDTRRVRAAVNAALDGVDGTR